MNGFQGGTGRCLQTKEANGLGEGWSDAFASWLQHKDASIPDFVIGAFVAFCHSFSASHFHSSWINNYSGGLRSKPYSTNAYVFLLCGLMTC
jgi:extracellular elastinolytic metalloproteinase